MSKPLVDYRPCCWLVVLTPSYYFVENVVIDRRVTPKVRDQEEKHSLKIEK
jgi:hypothetical protein